MPKTFVVKLDDSNAPEPIGERTLELSLEEALGDKDIDIVEVKQQK